MFKFWDSVMGSDAAYHSWLKKLANSTKTR
jgi:hypothetical protein